MEIKAQKRQNKNLSRLFAHKPGLLVIGCYLNLTFNCAYL